MQKRLQRLDGVAKVEVNLIGQKLVVLPKPDGTINLTEVLKATDDGGVSPVEMIVTATGRLARDTTGALVFQPAANQSFELVPNEASKALEELAGSATQVTLRGVMYREPAKKQKKRFEALRFEILNVQGRE